MIFNGTNKTYKKILIISLPLSAVMLFIAFFTQGDHFSAIYAFLFTAGAGAATLAGFSLFYMFIGSEKKVVLTKNELRLEEGKRPKVAKYSEIRDVKFNGTKIVIKLSKGSIAIINMHGYPLKDIYQHLEEKREKQAS